MEVGTSQDEIDVITNFAVKDSHLVLSIALQDEILTNNNYISNLFMQMQSKGGEKKIFSISS